MTKVNRADYVRRSRLYFELSFVSAILLPVYAAIYVGVSFGATRLFSFGLKVVLAESGILTLTWILFRLYKADLKLLKSENKFIQTRDINIDSADLGGDDIYN